MGSNQSSTESNPPPVISCPECRNRLNPELVSFLLNGQTVYCEVCGFPFHAIEDGEVKPLEKKDNYNYSQKSLSREESQWIAWKKEWQNIKSQIKTEFSSAFSGVFSKKTIQEERKVEQKGEQPVDKFEYKTDADPSPISPPISGIPIKPHDQEIVNNLHTAKSVLVELSPFYYAFIIIITFFTSLRAGLWFNLIGTLLIDFFIVIYDHKVFLSQDKENNVSHAGIPMILFGLFSLGANGIGVFLLARGILNLLLFLKEAQAISSTHPAISDNPQIKAIWIREILYSFIPYVFELFIVFLLAGVIKDLGALILTGRDLGGFLYMIFSGGIVVIVIYRLILPTLQRNPIEKIPADKAIILIVCGIFALSTGSGLFFILVGILILVFQNMIQNTAINLPDVREIRDISNSLVVDGINPNNREITPAHIPHTLNFHESKNQAPIYEAPINYSQINETPIKRFDPQTGAPLTKSMNKGGGFQNIPAIVPTSYSPESVGNLSQSNIRVVPDPGTITNTIFTVLDLTLRKRLIHLPVSEEEKDSIAKSFLYLTMDEQKRFMTELEQVNISHEDYYSKYINRIRGLPIAKKQQDFLIQQLNYLPDEEIEEYLRVLEDLS